VDGKFLTDTVETLSKRAALRCCNPDCDALTSGPSSDAIASINVGEAAHIYGRTPSSARYRTDLTMAELSDITNGIWLCRNCHKLIDSDPLQFTADLLFEWRRHHERVILEQLGRPGDRLRGKLQAEALQSFEGTSRLAQQIVLDRPPYWNFKLAAELLRTELGSIYQRWHHLKLGMYARKSAIVQADEIAPWFSAKLNDISKIIQSVSPIFQELNKALVWPNESCDPKDILILCKLVAGASQNFLEWEEDVRFVHVDDKFNEMLVSMQGLAAHQLDQILRFPAELAKLLSNETPKGTYELNLVFDVPDIFIKSINAAIAQAFEKS
jgi:hypothetical protein